MTGYHYLWTAALFEPSSFFFRMGCGQNWVDTKPIFCFNSGASHIPKTLKKRHCCGNYSRIALIICQKYGCLILSEAINTRNSFHMPDERLLMQCPLMFFPPFSFCKPLYLYFLLCITLSELRKCQWLCHAPLQLSIVGNGISNSSSELL